MKKLFVILLLVAGLFETAKADSKLYMFVNSYPNLDIVVSIDGTDVANLNGDICRTMDPVGPMVLPLEFRNDTFREIDITGEGDIIVTVKCDFTNPVTKQVTPYKSEYRLNTEDGSYYLQIVQDGSENDFKIEELNSKEAEERMKTFQKLPAAAYTIDD